MFHTRITALVLIITLAAPSAGRRWNSTGHETVARIAWDYMTPRARASAVHLLRSGPALANLKSLEPTVGTQDDRDRGLFVACATWPDRVRELGSVWHAYNMPPWHFADNYWKDVNGHGVTDASSGPAAENAIERLTLFSDDMRSATAADTTKAKELAWIIHLVGDVHQPLHTSSRETTALPTGDRGGNLFLLRGTPKDLHAFWDDILDESIPVEAGEVATAYIDRLATTLERSTPHAGIAADALKTDYTAWATAGLSLAEANAYPPTLVEKAKPSAAYLAATAKIADRQIALAGYRLAQLMNGLFP